MPLEMPEFDDMDEMQGSSFRKTAPRAPWWRPTTRFGRILLTLGVCSVVAVSAYAYYTAKTFIERDNRFRIAGSGDIETIGLGQVTRADLIPVFGEDIGRNIFFVPLSERRKQLEQIPWVESAIVMRLLPNQIKVTIVERTPAAFVRRGQQIGLIDASGVLLDMPAASLAKHHYSFPVISGIKADDAPSVRQARMATYERLITGLDSSGQHYSNQISQIDLSDPADARVTIPEQGSDIVAHFGENDFFARYNRYQSHIAEWRQQYPKLTEVDLRYDQQVVLEMNHGASPATLPAEALSSTDSGIGAAQSTPSPAAVASAPKSVAMAKTQQVALHGTEASKTVLRTVERSSKASTHTLRTKASVLIRQREIENRAKRMRLKREKEHRAELHRAHSKPSTTTHSAASGKGQ